MPSLGSVSWLRLWLQPPSLCSLPLLLWFNAKWKSRLYLDLCLLFKCFPHVQSCQSGHDWIYFFTYATGYSDRWPLMYVCVCVCAFQVVIMTTLSLLFCLCCLHKSCIKINLRHTEINRKLNCDWMLQHSFKHFLIPTLCCFHVEMSSFKVLLSLLAEQKQTEWSKWRVK